MDVGVGDGQAADQEVVEAGDGEGGGPGEAGIGAREELGIAVAGGEIAPMTVCGGGIEIARDQDVGRGVGGQLPGQDGQAVVSGCGVGRSDRGEVDGIDDEIASGVVMWVRRPRCQPMPTSTVVVSEVG